MAVSPHTLGIIILSILMNALAQIFLSISLKGKSLVIPGDPVQSLYAIATNLGVLVALAVYGLSVVLWMYVLSKTDVSLAYPFLGLGFVFVAFFSYFFLGEPLGVQKFLGISLVAIGIVLLARS
ncbi:SMR family transporter [Qipengyuania zhejiangensis]|uniref:SMR family transporter n=1 Tax=Qipengyuania zhejiangensis TaxID=3077782 RepID=UPI002D78C16D|nr:SMR family transporter [Qipengyuania sp. Z2]